MCLESVVVTKSGFLGVAKSCGDTIASHVGDCGLGVGNYGPALDVETFNFGERAADDYFGIRIGSECLKDWALWQNYAPEERMKEVDIHCVTTVKTLLVSTVIPEP